MVNNVGPGNVYALSGRHCGPHSPSIKQSILNWHDPLLKDAVITLSPIECALLSDNDFA